MFYRNLNTGWWDLDTSVSDECILAMRCPWLASLEIQVNILKVDVITGHIFAAVDRYSNACLGCPHDVLVQYVADIHTGWNLI